MNRKTPIDTIYIREGVTRPRRFTLGRYVDGKFQADDLTGFGDIDLHRVSKRDEEEDSLTYDDGRVTVTDAINGVIQVNPEAGDFLLVDGSYDCYFLATDASGEIVDYPQDGIFIWKVIKRNAP